MTPPLLEARNLVKHYGLGARWLEPSRIVPAVQGVSLSLRKGETLGLVGESGCGKSTLGRCLLRLVEPTAGEIFFDGQPLLGLTRSALKPYRRRAQIIFQDPYSSLDPRMTVGEILAEPLRVHGLGGTREERRERVAKLLRQVGLEADCMLRYPHEFSGGQRQRIGIARALAVEPELVICDEPVSALDVSIQAQILNLLLELQETLGLTYLFISHDIKVVEHLSHRVAVMYLGQIVEEGPTDQVCRDPRHPYTQALLSAVLSPTKGGQVKPILLTGEPVVSFATASAQSGCPFEPRCPSREARCARVAPTLEVVKGTPSRRVSCLLAD